MAVRSADVSLAQSSPLLHQWLGQVRAAGLPVGPRELLNCHRLWWQLAWQGRLPASALERLRLLGPLLCHSPEQQQRYADLLATWAPHTSELDGSVSETAGVEGTSQGEDGGAPLSEAEKGRRARWALALLLVCGALLAGWLYGRGGEAVLQPSPEAASQPVGPENPPSAPSAPLLGASLPAESASAPASVSVSVSASVSAPASRPALEGPAASPVAAALPPAAASVAASAVAPPPVEALAPGWRWAGVAVGGLAALLWLWRAWSWWRRRLFAKAGQAFEEELLHHVLHDPQAQPPQPRASVLRPVATVLRQQIDGGRVRLDVKATVRASIRQGGVLQPRFMPQRVTPEYLALIDWAGPQDQQARFHESLVAALVAQGVAVQVFHYRGSPAWGCWRLGPPEADGYRSEHDRVKFEVLLTRYAHHRLLVFGDVRALVHPDTGQPLPWATQTRQFAQRAWFTPLPLVSWGAAEHWAAAPEGLDFLLLPMEEAALHTLAGWLASGRAQWVPHPQGPLHYPPLLKGQALAWVQRPHPPEPWEQAQLMAQLRAYMGEQRLVWLAACAVFPALSWPLTLGLGRWWWALLAPQEGPRDEATQQGALALGLGVLAALPWFRHGHMPDWLRACLIAELDEGQRASLRAWLLDYLSVDKLALSGEEAARLSVWRRQRWRAWLGSGRGVLNDAVLLDFLTPAVAPPLALRLPEGLRRALFRRGQVLRGLRPWANGVAAVPLVGLVLAWPGVWEEVVRWWGPAPVVPAPVAEPVQPPASVASSPDVAASPVVVVPLGEPSAPNQECVRGVCFEMVAIPTGTFQMGSPDSESGRFSDEGPVHAVNVKGFRMGKTEVTQGLWKAVMGSNPSRFSSCGDNCPVETVSWNGAQEFIKKLNGLTGNKYRLPSEAEWEYAARAGTKNRWSFGDQESQLGEYAWYTADSDSKTHPVGQKKPNPWGLHDMHGNVHEWVQDAWMENYNGAPIDGSVREGNSVVARVLRGGSWDGEPLDLRSAYRYRYTPDDRINNLGLRLARIN